MQFLQKWLLRRQGKLTTFFSGEGAQLLKTLVRKLVVAWFWVTKLQTEITRRITASKFTCAPSLVAGAIWSAKTNFSIPKETHSCPQNYNRNFTCHWHFQNDLSSLFATVTKKGRATKISKVCMQHTHSFLLGAINTLGKKNVRRVSLTHSLSF